MTQILFFCIEVYFKLLIVQLARRRITVDSNLRGFRLNHWAGASFFRSAGRKFPDALHFQRRSGNDTKKAGGVTGFIWACTWMVIDDFHGNQRCEFNREIIEANEVVQLNR